MTDDIAAGPPIVLLHGWGGSTRTTWRPLGWDRSIAAARRAPIAVDLLGHGNAAAVVDPEAYTGLARHAERGFAGHDVVDAIGFSLGAKVLLSLAAEQPDRFRRIVVSGVGDNVFRPEALGVLADCLEVGMSESVPEQLRQYVVYGLGSGNNARAIAACLRRPWTPFTPDHAARIRCPVLVALGEHDAIAGDIDPLLDALVDGRLVWLPGVDHLGTPYAPRFREAALAFLTADAV